MFNSQRWSELDLAQSEEILAILAQVSKPSDTLRKSMTIIKTAIKEETEAETTELDDLITRVSARGFKDETLLSRLNLEATELKEKAVKTKEKYFDSDGRER
mgnify:FL=1